MLAVVAVAPAPAFASGVAYPDADWTEATIPSPSQEGGDATLHADILRPKGSTDANKTPVILSIGPYFNHAGQVGAAGPVQDAPYDPVGPNEGPSERFQDLVEGSGLLKKGYTFVMVDLRGFGGSTGCLDWSGPGEQADVVNAVNWAASQPWSTGRVGMYGKSYDALTGLIGVNKRPSGLAAVVAQEPVYDDYRYLYGDGIRRSNSIATPALYDGIAATPGPLTDDPNYNVASLNDPLCLAQNWASQAADDDHESDFWKLRNLIPGAAGSNVPLFLTQGFTENNTVPDGLQQYLDNHTGYTRAWLGPWDHVRGNETDEDGKLLMGRAGWFDEVMRFYDRFLKDIPAAEHPIAVQTNDGTWRSEAHWPPADKALFTTGLRAGSYVDTATSWPTGTPDDPTSNAGLWMVSKPLPYDLHFAGSGSASVDVTTTIPRANLVVDVYDLDASGTGPLITRQAHMIRGTGDSTIPLQLWDNDWRIAAGHRIGVRVTDNNQDFWLGATPTAQPVTVRGGSISLPFLRYRRTETIAGDPGVQLEDVLEDTVTAPDVAGSEVDFTLPPPLETAPPGSEFTGGYIESLGGSASSKGGVAAARARLTARLIRRGRRLIVKGIGPANKRVKVTLLRNGRKVRAKRVTTKAKGRYRVVFRVKRKGRYRARVTTRIAGQKLTARTAVSRLR